MTVRQPFGKGSGLTIIDVTGIVLIVLGFSMTVLNFFAVH